MGNKEYKKNEKIAIKITEDEKEKIKVASLKSFLSPSTFVRKVALERAREIERGGTQ